MKYDYQILFSFVNCPDGNTRTIYLIWSVQENRIVHTTTSEAAARDEMNSLNYRANAY